LISGNRLSGDTPHSSPISTSGDHLRSRAVDLVTAHSVRNRNAQEERIERFALRPSLRTMPLIYSCLPSWIELKPSRTLPPLIVRVDPDLAHVKE
jgi:hypothetical protein